MKLKYPKLTTEEIRLRSDMLKEFNPMLGHRGIRIAISYPEIYNMQVRAIFEAAYSLKKEGIDVKPEIMIPLVMSANEIKTIRNGKKIEGKSIRGIRDIDEEVRKNFDSKPLASLKVSGAFPPDAAQIPTTLSSLKSIDFSERTLKTSTIVATGFFRYCRDSAISTK